MGLAILIDEAETGTALVGGFGLAGLRGWCRRSLPLAEPQRIDDPEATPGEALEHLPQEPHIEVAEHFLLFAGLDLGGLHAALPHLRRGGGELDPIGQGLPQPLDGIRPLARAALARGDTGLLAAAPHGQRLALEMTLLVMMKGRELNAGIGYFHGGGPPWPQVLRIASPPRIVPDSSAGERSLPLVSAAWPGKFRGPPPQQHFFHRRRPTSAPRGGRKSVATGNSLR